MRKLLTAALLLAVALTASAQADRHEVRQGNRLFKAGKFEAADISYRKAQLKDSTSYAAGYNLANSSKRMYTITRINSLRTITDFPVNTTLKTRFLFNNWNTDVLRNSRIDRRFKHYNRTCCKVLSYRS